MDDLDYRRVEKALLYLDEHFRRQPSLAEVAKAVGLSEYHFQRLFRRWVGVSPKRFLQFLTASYARELLEASWPALETAYEAGLSGTGRLHDLLISVEAATPGEVRRRGAGVVIRYGVHPSPFGECLVAATGRGVCGVSFLDEKGVAPALDELRRRWPLALLAEGEAETAGLAERIFGAAPDAEPLRLHLAGTNFQLRVWEALLRLPAAAATTYERLAAAVESPRALRAVGSAVGANPLAYLIPCHRVIRKTGAYGEYRWGVARKKAMLGWEAARAGGAGVARSAVRL